MSCDWIGWCAMKPEVQAAWVQAVGSIVAVCVAIWVPWRQSRQLQKRERTIEARRAAGLAMEAVPLLRNNIERLNEFFHGIEPLPEHERFIAAAIRAHELKPGDGIYKLATRADVLGEIGARLQTAIFKLTDIAYRLDELQYARSTALDRGEKETADQAADFVERVRSRIDEAHELAVTLADLCAELERMLTRR